MRICAQRVTEASVRVDGEVVGAAGRGLLLFVGIGEADTLDLLAPMARKVVNLRVFPDAEGKSHFDRSVLEERGDLLVVSQFTLCANCRKGRRPSFSQAAEPAEAERLFNVFVDCLKDYGLQVATGRFGAGMEVALVNDGPVTLWLDSDEVLPGSAAPERNE